MSRVKGDRTAKVLFRSRLVESVPLDVSQNIPRLCGIGVEGHGSLGCSFPDGCVFTGAAHQLAMRVRQANPGRGEARIGVEGLLELLSSRAVFVVTVASGEVVIAPKVCIEGYRVWRPRATDRRLVPRANSHLDSINDLLG